MAGFSTLPHYGNIANLHNAATRDGLKSRRQWTADAHHTRDTEMDGGKNCTLVTSFMVGENPTPPPPATQSSGYLKIPKHIFLSTNIHHSLRLKLSQVSSELRRAASASPAAPDGDICWSALFSASEPVEFSPFLLVS